MVVGLPIIIFSLKAQSIVKAQIQAQTKSNIGSDVDLVVSRIKLWEARNESELLRITDSNSLLTRTLEKYRETSSNENKKKYIKYWIDPYSIRQPILSWFLWIQEVEK